MSLWDRKARYYDAFRKPFGWILRRENQNVRALLNGVSWQGKRVLDIGTGTGNALRCLPAEVRRFALDSSVAMLRQVRQGEGVRVIAGAAEALPVKSGCLDGALLIGVMEYFEPGAQQRLLQEVARVLVPRGHAVITYSPRGVWNTLRVLLGHRLHLMNFSEFERQVAKAGLVIEKHMRSLLQGQCRVSRL